MSLDILADSTISEAAGWETANKLHRTMAALFGDAWIARQRRDLLCNNLCWKLLPVTICSCPTTICFYVITTNEVLQRTNSSGETGDHWSSSRILKLKGTRWWKIECSLWNCNARNNFNNFQPVQEWRKQQSNQTVLFLKINTGYWTLTRYVVHGHFILAIAKRTRLRERKTNFAIFVIACSLL